MNVMIPPLRQRRRETDGRRVSTAEYAFLAMLALTLVIGAGLTVYYIGWGNN